MGIAGRFAELLESVIVQDRVALAEGDLRQSRSPNQGSTVLVVDILAP